LDFPGPNPFGTKHDGLRPGWPGPAQFPALLMAIVGHPRHQVPTPVAMDLVVCGTTDLAMDQVPTPVAMENIFRTNCKD
jgi:hypothetical protein